MAINVLCCMYINYRIPWILVALANYVRNPQKIANIFAFYDISIGFYVLRFYTDGKPKYLIVDDYIPCDSNTNQPLFAFPVGNRLWVALIEKAWAKILGSYFGIELITSDSFMQNVTGGPVQVFELQKDSNKKLIQYSRKGYSIVLRSGDAYTEGMISDIDYSLLKVVQYKGTYIYKIRNPWGQCEPNSGDYGQSSGRWTPELRRICDQKNGDDGVFFLSQPQFLSAFTFYTVGMDEPNFKYSFLEFQSKAQQSVYFKFDITKKQHLAIKVTQPFKRLINDQEYQYSFAYLELGQIDRQSMMVLNEEEVKYQESSGDRYSYITDKYYDEYDPGTYLVRVQMDWILPKFNKAVLSVYCGENVTIERVKSMKDKAGFKKRNRDQEQ